MEVRRHCGFRDFGDLEAQVRLNRRLYALCWTGTHRPGVLFDRATTWLLAQKVLLPAVTTLERHVGRLRSPIEERVWKILTAAASLETRSKLESLLLVADGGHQSLLDRDPTAFVRLTICYVIIVFERSLSPACITPAVVRRAISTYKSEWCFLTRGAAARIVF